MMIVSYMGKIVKKIPKKNVFFFKFFLVFQVHCSKPKLSAILLRVKFLFPAKSGPTKAAIKT